MKLWKCSAFLTFLYVALWAYPDNVGPVYVSTAPAEVQLTRAGGWVRFLMDITPPIGRRIFASFGYGGRRFTLICGMVPDGPTNSSCTAFADNTCLPGSALASITDSSITKPYIVDIAAGVYPECVGIEEQSYITLRGAGIDRTIIRPAVVFDGDSEVEGGVVRVSRNGEARSTHITFMDMTAHNDDFSAPEAAFQFGEEACTAAAAATWDEVTLIRVKAIGHHDAIQWCGDRQDDASIEDLPTLHMRDVLAFGGRDTIVKKGNGRVFAQNVFAEVRTNYCETADETFLGEVTGTAGAGVDTTHFDVESADDPNIDNFFVGRRVLFTGGTCAAGGRAWIMDYDEATARATYEPATAFTVDATCTYTIDAVGEVEEAPCRDMDWTLIASENAHGYWKYSSVHLGAGGNPTTSALLDTFIMRDSQLRIRINDYGTKPETTGCFAATQGFVAGVLVHTQTWQTVEIDADIDIRINMDLGDGMACEAGIAGVVVAPSATVEDQLLYTGNITIDNPGDPNAIIRGIANLSTGSTVVAPESFIDINNTVAGYSGSSSHLYQSAGTLMVGNIKSDDPIAQSGMIGHLASLNAGLTGSSTLDFANAASGACSSDLTISVSGAKDGDLVDLAYPNGAVDPNGSSFQAWVSGDDTVTVRHCCAGASTACDPNSEVFLARVNQ